jgi:predicted NAD/FAD-dependent oxidoreductase
MPLPKRAGKVQGAMRVLVVGAGPNGLVAAIHLAAHGLEVTVLEHSATTPGVASSSAETTMSRRTLPVAHLIVLGACRVPAPKKMVSVARRRACLPAAVSPCRVGLRRMRGTMASTTVYSRVTGRHR